MKTSYRLDQIYALLLRDGSTSVNDLAEEFQVTPTTIRRDLLVLEERKLITRSRGMAYIKEGNIDTPTVFMDEKKAIGRAAAKYIKSNMTVSLDSGTTVEAVCDAMIEDKNIKDIDIVTHSLPTAIKASKYYNVSMPSGAVLSTADALVGVDVENFYSSITVDVAILGSTGIADCDGLTVSYPLQLSVKQKQAQCASKTIAVLDSSKFLRRGIYSFCSFDNLDILITRKTKENEKMLEEIASHGVEIVLV